MEKRNISFFMVMKKVPTVTHQEKQVHVVNGKPYFYEPSDLKAARVKLQAHLSQYVPGAKFVKPVELMVKWCFKSTAKHEPGEYRSTKPDLDNLQKLLKDCMTDVGFWKDDALVVREISEKFWSDIPGIFISIKEV